MPARTEKFYTDNIPIMVAIDMIEINEKPMTKVQLRKLKTLWSFLPTRIVSVFASFLVLLGCQTAQFPYGGACKDANVHVSDSINRNVVVGRYFRLMTDDAQRVCEHNITFSKENGHSYMTISTHKGDGIGNVGHPSSSGWSDIDQKNRRRFELVSSEKILPEQSFRFQYSIRIPADNQFIEGDDPVIVDEPNFYIFQLKGKGSESPALSFKINQSTGITVLGMKVKTPERFREWTKITLEYRPSVENNGYARLFIDDKKIYDESNYRNIYNETDVPYYHIKFGIYQSVREPKWMWRDRRQKIDIKDLSFELL